MYVQLCYHRRVGVGVRACQFIPKGTRVLYCYRNVCTTSQAKKEKSGHKTHLLTIPGTGCSVEGTYATLFESDGFPDFNKKFSVPSPLLTMANSSQNYIDSNCRIVITNMAMLYKNDIWLDHTAFLVTTRDVQMYEELIWDYSLVDI